jgi:hypothetical protein
VNSFFDNMMKGLEGASSAIEAFKQKWSEMVLNVRLAGVRGVMKLMGRSDSEIQNTETDIKERFKLQSGLTEAVELRSLKLPPNITNYLEELNNRLGSGAVRALNISKAWADIKQKAYQNEIKALEQGLTLMNKQKDIAEAMSAVAAARRALVARGYELGVQVAASPEARAQAEARLSDLKLRQEKEAIAERRGILQTERELQQRQMLIQEKQIKIQQEQLKIQLAEARADQVRVAEATQGRLRARGNTSPRSPEWMGFTRELNVLAAEGTRNVARIAGAREALRLAFEAEGQLGTISGLDAQRLNLQEQQLDIQGQSARYTREQQALLAQISEAEQRITNNLTRATNEQNRKKQALESQSNQLSFQNTLLERQERLQKAQSDLAVTRAKAQVQAAQRLAEIQELQDRARNGGGTASVIEAQIAAAAAGVSGMETAAQVQERLYRAKEQQMVREHELQQRQLEVQQKREESEILINRLKFESQRVDAALQRDQIMAEIARLREQQRRDAISPKLAGATTVPGLGNAQGSVAAIPAGARTGRSRDPDAEASGWDIVMPGGRGAPVRAPVPLTITGTGFQGRGAGATGRGYGNWISGEFQLGGKKFEMLLGHFDRIDVAPGMQIPVGGQIGTQGITGRTFGTHVTTHVNPKGGASVADAWGALETITQTWERGAAAGRGGVAIGSGTSTTQAAANGAVVTSTANRAEDLRQQLKAVDERDRLIAEQIKSTDDLNQTLKDRFSLEKENLSEQQQSDRAQLAFEQAKAQLTAQVMKTPEGRLAIATGDAVSSSITGSVSGALQALLGGGDAQQAVSSALAQLGQSLMQTTLDSLLNPLLQQLQGSLVKLVTGVDIQGGAQQAAAASMQGAAVQHQSAATQLSTAAQALIAAASAGAAGGAGQGGDMFGSVLKKLPGLFGGIGDFSGAFSGSNLLDFGGALDLPALVTTTAAPSFAQAFTSGMAGGGEIKYGLDYLVGEKNAEIVRFNKAGGKVYSNRALTQALGVPFQRTPGGGAAVADDLGVPFQRAPGGGKAAEGIGERMGIPFLKPMVGNGQGGGAGGMAGSNALRVRVDTQVINSVEYATVAQLQQTAAASAEAGRNAVYHDLRNNPSIQRSLGMG